MTLPARHADRLNRRIVMQMSDVMREMREQDTRWGAARNHPDVDPALDEVKSEHNRLYGLRLHLHLLSADRVQEMVDAAARLGRSSWALIALEEFCEAIEAQPGRHRRGELVQLIAVLFQWIDNIDRREVRRRGKHERPDGSSDAGRHARARAPGRPRARGARHQTRRTRR